MIETPHSVTLDIPELAVVPEGWVAAPDSAGTVALRVQMTPKLPAFAIERYGVELERPMKMMGNLDDEPWFVMQGAKITWAINGRERTFHIRSACRLHANGDDCDHISVMLEEEMPNG